MGFYRYYSSIKFILPYFPFLSFLYFSISIFASFLSLPLFSTSSDLILCRFPFTTRSYFLKFVIFVLRFINEFISVNENTTNSSFTKSCLIFFLITSMIRNSIKSRNSLIIFFDYIHLHQSLLFFIHFFF